MEGFAIGAIAPVEEELFGLHGCDLLGSGDYKELIDAGSIAVADALKSGFERNWQTQGEDCDFGGHGSILLELRRGGSRRYRKCAPPLSPTPTVYRHRPGYSGQAAVIFWDKELEESGRRKTEVGLGSCSPRSQNRDRGHPAPGRTPIEPSKSRFYRG